MLLTQMPQISLLVPMALAPVSAGLPTQNETGIEWVDLREFFNLKECLIVKVSGSSMETRISSGDLVIVNPNLTPISGDIVVADIGNDEHIVKLFRPDSRRGLKLVSLNKTYSEIAPTALNIMGVVEWIFSRTRGLHRLGQ